MLSNLSGFSIVNPKKRRAFQEITGTFNVPEISFASATTSSVVTTITNYDASITYAVSSSAGSASRVTDTVTVSGLTSNQSVTTTVTATGSTGLEFSTTTPSIPSLPATPTLSRSGGTTTTVSVLIGNYDAGLTYTIGSTVGSATRSGNTITVTGLTEGQAVTVTATASNASGNSAQGSLATNAVPATPTLSASGITSSSATVTITNYNASYSYSVSSSSGSASRSGNTITVTGLSPNTSVTVNATATNNGINSAQGSTSFTTLQANWILELSSSDGGIGFPRVALDSSNNTFVSASNFGAMQKISPSKSVIYSKRITINSNSVNVDAAITDSSGNFYLVARFGSNQISIVKLNSNLATVWCKYFTSTSEVNGTGGIAVDSTGNLYYGGFNSSGYARIVKFNSSGSIVWNVLADSYSPLTDVSVDPDGNVTASAFTSTNYSVVYKFNSSGTLQWRKIYNTSPNQSTIARGVRSTSSYVYASGTQVSSSNFNNSLGVVKLSAANGVPVWYRNIINNSLSGLFGYSFMAMDNSENIYAVGDGNSNDTKWHLLKTNSSGSISFFRLLQKFGSILYSGPVDVNSTNMLISASSNNSNGYIVNAPADGSKTGSYGVLNYSNVTSYTTSTAPAWMTVQNASTNFTLNPSLSIDSGTVSITNYTNFTNSFTDM